MNPVFTKLAALRPWLGRRAPWLVLLLLIALWYYASYYRYGIYFRDEGGTVTLLAKRLLNGERPFIDVVLGYNVGWFYPVVGLFKLFGVNYVLLRVYCFALSTVTAALGFLAIVRAGGRPWLAFLVGLLLVLVPGMTFKNYMPLLAVGNSFCLLHFALAPRGRENAENELALGARRRDPWFWICIGGLALGLTYLIRIDVGIFCTLLWLGGIGFRAVEPGGMAKERGAMAAGGPALLLAIVLAVHLPVYLDAAHRGFGTEFVGQYLAWPKSLVIALEGRFAPAKAPTLPRPALAPAASETPAPLPGQPGHFVNRDVLKRKDFSDLDNAKNPADRWKLLELTLLLYAPLLSLAALTAAAAITLLSGLWRSDSAKSRRALGALLLLGGALTTFPQYFFFRADTPHLSEFSPGFWVAVTGGSLLLGAGRGSLQSWRTWLGLLLVLFLVLHAGLYLNRMLFDRAAGTIDANRELTKLIEAGNFKKALHGARHAKMFHGANGTDVLVSEREFEGLNAIVKIVQAHSSPTDYLVAYPYHPSFNVITDRPTYEKNVYIDNATRSRNWDAEAIARLEKFKPAVVITSDWAINGSEESKFSVWAEKTKAWIQSHYKNRGTFLDFEVYTLD